MGRAASKSYFQDSSLHSADISTACWCLSFHLCTTLSCPLHQVKTKQTNKNKKTPTKTRNKQKNPTNPQPLSTVISAVGAWLERVEVIFQFGGNHADLDSGLCSVWERDMFPGSSSLVFILMLDHPKAKQPQYLPPVQLRSWACFRCAVRV